MHDDRTPHAIGRDIGRDLWDAFAEQIAPHEDGPAAVAITLSAMAEFLAISMTWVTADMPMPEQLTRTQAFFRDLEHNLVATIQAYHLAKSMRN